MPQRLVKSAQQLRNMVWLDEQAARFGNRIVGQFREPELAPLGKAAY
jgi:hypothetical protein